MDPGTGDAVDLERKAAGGPPAQSTLMTPPADDALRPGESRLPPGESRLP